MKKIRTLIVDDSVVFRSQIRAAIEMIEGLEVAGVASNGKIALDKMAASAVDLVILDLEMPELNGIEMLKALRERKSSAKIIVFSAFSTRGAEVTLEALSLGASDFVAKPSLENTSAAEFKNKPSEYLQYLLRPKIENLFMDLNHASISEKVIDSDFNWRSFIPRAIVIGCSTGGPTALEKIFSQIRGPIKCPIFIVQHMPPVFTASLAERITKLSGIDCREAIHGEVVKANRAYMAPGNFHMELLDGAGGPMLMLNQNSQENSVRPAVDPLFRTASKVYKSACLGFVLTGMGQDGLEGAKALRQGGAPVVIQDKESCVVFGMPGAIFEASQYDSVKNLDEIAATLKSFVV